MEKQIKITNLIKIKFQFKFKLYYSKTDYAKLVRKNCPYTYELGTSLYILITTDSKTELRIGNIKGGAEIKGTLYRFKTKPRAILKYYNNRNNRRI